MGATMREFWGSASLINNRGSKKRGKTRRFRRAKRQVSVCTDTYLIIMQEIFSTPADNTTTVEISVIERIC